MSNDKDRGLYDKFRVERVDGKHKPGERHHGCRYFVLDIDHDEHAPDALYAYADSCETDYPNLARDLRSLGDRAVVTVRLFPVIGWNRSQQSRTRKPEGRSMKEGKTTTEFKLALLNKLAGFVVLAAGLWLEHKGQDGNDLVLTGIGFLLGTQAIYTGSRTLVKNKAAESSAGSQPVVQVREP